MEKIQSWDEAQNTVTKWKSEECKAVFTNGCFDILHSGHVTYLEKAKSQVDYLILGLNSDSSIKTIKGKKGPL